MIRNFYVHRPSLFRTQKLWFRLFLWPESFWSFIMLPRSFFSLHNLHHWNASIISHDGPKNFIFFFELDTEAVFWLYFLLYWKKASFRISEYKVCLFFFRILIQIKLFSRFYRPRILLLGTSSSYWKKSFFLTVTKVLVHQFFWVSSDPKAFFFCFTKTKFSSVISFWS